MKRITIILFVLLLIAGYFAVTVQPKEPTPTKPPVKKSCTDIEHPCYILRAPNDVALYLNSWKHYGNTNCVNFTSLPDGDFHGYCGIYEIHKLHN